MSRDSFAYLSVTGHDTGVTVRSDHAAQVSNCASVTAPMCTERQANV